MTNSRRDTLKKLGALGALGVTGLAGCSGDGGDGSDGGDGGDGGASTPTSGDGDDSTTEDGDGMDGATTTSAGDEMTSTGDTVTAAYVYNEEVVDLGWVNTHEKVRKKLVDRYDWYETQIVEDISVSEAETTFQDLANQDIDIIEAATFGYGEPAAKVVQNNDVYVETPRMARVEGYSGPRLGYYFGKLEQPSYVVGRAAAMLTESNLLGYVNSFAIPSTLVELNGLALGAKSVNPDVEIEVRNVGTWYDPGKERSAAQDLVDQGADVLGYRTSTPAIFDVAEGNDLWAYGYADGFAGTELSYDKYITSRMWDWTPFFDETANAAREGNVGDESRFNVDEVRGNYFGFDRGGVQLDDYGPNVPSEVVDDMESTAEEFTDGEMTSDDIFADTQWADWSEFRRVNEMGSYTDNIRGSADS